VALFHSRVDAPLTTQARPTDGKKTYGVGVGVPVWVLEAGADVRRNHWHSGYPNPEGEVGGGAHGSLLKAES